MKNERLKDQVIIESEYEVEELIDSLHVWDDESEDNSLCHFRFVYINENIIVRVCENKYQRENRYGNVEQEWDTSVEEIKKDFIDYLLMYKDEINSEIKEAKDY